MRGRGGRPGLDPDLTLADKRWSDLDRISSGTTHCAQQRVSAAFLWCSTQRVSAAFLWRSTQRMSAAFLWRSTLPRPRWLQDGYRTYNWPLASDE